MEGGGDVLTAMHVHSRMSIEPRIPKYNAGTEHVGFSLARQTLHQSRSAVSCSVSRRKDAQHPINNKNRL